jgi:oligoendopeptidase F
MQDVEDYYTYYVIILGMSEDLFWDVDLSFLIGVLENKMAYDDYMSYMREVELEAMEKRR